MKDITLNSDQERISSINHLHDGRYSHAFCSCCQSSLVGRRSAAARFTAAGHYLSARRRETQVSLPVALTANGFSSRMSFDSHHDGGENLAHLYTCTRTGTRCRQQVKSFAEHVIVAPFHSVAEYLTEGISTGGG